MEGTRMRINLNNVDLCFDVVGVVLSVIIVGSGDGSASSVGTHCHLGAILRLSNRADVIDEVFRYVLFLLVVLDERGAFVRLVLVLVMMG